MLIQSAHCPDLDSITNTLKEKHLIPRDLEQLENSNKFSRNRHEPRLVSSSVS